MSVILTNLPNLPEGVKNGVAARKDRVLYAGLGSAGKRFFCLNLDDLDSGWKSTTDFPGTQRSDAVCIADDDGIWIFSGAGTPEGSTHAQVLTDVYRFEYTTQKWDRIESEIPVGLLGGSGCEIAKGHFVFFGGYSKPTFDDFCQKMSSIDENKNPNERVELLTTFMSLEPEQYGWNKDIILYDTIKNRWEILQQNPFSANCGAALIRAGNQVTLINGEIKPGLRSTEVKQFTFDDANHVESMLLPSICETQPGHEGLAGAYAGQLDGHLLAVGGAYFIGSQENRLKEQWYTHQGLNKHYSDEVWCLNDGAWTMIAKMPQGMAYGSSLNSEKELILVGGEDSKQQALVGCYMVTWP